jgi:tetratricopeptide (TPR) repeat protein
MNAGLYREAVQILERPDLPITSRDRYVGTHLISLHFLGEHDKELRIVREGKRRNPDRRHEWVQLESNALAALGRVDELEVLLEEAVRGVGTFWASVYLFEAGQELLWHGHEREGRKVLERREALLRADPLESPSDLARTILWLGCVAEARVLYEQLASVARDSLDRYAPLAAAAMAAAGLGDRDAALRISAELAMPQDNPPARRWNAFRRAEIAGVLCDCDEAVRLLKESLRLGMAPVWIHGSYGLLYCRDYPAFQEVAKARG